MLGPRVVARAVAVVATIAVAVTAMVLVPASTAGAATRFVDVPPSSPFFDDIEWMDESAIATGYPGNLFKPGADVTRQAMAAFVHRFSDLFGGPTGPFTDPNFADVPTSSPFYDDIVWMAGTGITTGYPGNEFKPTAVVTRQAMAAFLHRLSGVLDGPPGPIGDSSFADVTYLTPFSDDISWMDEWNISTGYPGNLFKPGEPVARQAMAAFMHRLAILIPPFTGCTAQDQIPTTECDALVAFYTSTNGPTWDFDEGWLDNAAPCSWRGVTCATGHVTRLSLSVNGLTGTIPAELGDLTNLSYLSLYENNLTGTIPAELGNLTNLSHLTLEDNALTGSIPPELGSLTNLAYIYLRNNGLTGTIPAELGNLTNLAGLDLRDNSLTGTIPAELGNLTNLDALDLRENGLTGSIPAELGDLTKLITLYLSDNSLSGPIPAELGNLSDLVYLWLDGNSLEGEVPVQLMDLTELSGLYLFGNGCLTSSSAPLTSWLAAFDPLWDDGCA
jgi:hypothetical protein